MQIKSGIFKSCLLILDLCKFPTSAEKRTL